MEYLVVNDATDTVENVILWDGQEPWTPGEGYTALLRSSYPEAPHIGWVRNGNSFILPSNG